MSEQKHNLMDVGHLRMVSTQQAAELLGANQATIWRWIKDGTLPAYRLGRTFKIRIDELEAFIAARATSENRSNRWNPGNSEHAA